MTMHFFYIDCVLISSVDAFFLLAILGSFRAFAFASRESLLKV